MPRRPCCAVKEPTSSSALGHEGANAGTISLPTGPLIDIADSVVGVDVVVGDHNDLQVDAVRPNGVLVTENRGKGIRFTRIQIVVDKDENVVYKTADFHRPWDIGITPDPSIQADIDALNAQLAPIFNTVIGESTVAIPRADVCGSANGRLCESLIGDVVTDAMRTSYPFADFAITNSGGLRANLTCPSRRTSRATRVLHSLRRHSSSLVARCSRCCRSATSS